MIKQTRVVSFVDDDTIVIDNVEYRRTGVQSFSDGKVRIGNLSKPADPKFKVPGQSLTGLDHHFRLNRGTGEVEISERTLKEATLTGLKHTNPKDAIGSDKLPLHLWPTTATAMGCIGLLEGMAKYGRSNWRHGGVRASIYYDALRRHIDAWFEGEEFAPDSGVPHLANAIACLAILIDAEATDQLVDDRAFNGSGYRQLVEKLTPHVARLKKLHADKSPRHFTIKTDVSGPASGGSKDHA